MTGARASSRTPKARLSWPLVVVTAAAAGAVGALLSGRGPGWPEAVAGLVVLAALGVAAARLDSQGFVRAVVRGPRTRPLVALTFDDGPDPATTPAVLEALARHGARATFFVVGEKVEAHPELVRLLRAAGHEVASHGYAHRWQASLTRTRARANVERAASVIGAVTGAPPRFFRPAYGVVTPALGAVLTELGVSVAGWTRRTWDTRRAGDAVARGGAVAARASAGDIILLHDAPERAGGPTPLGGAMLDALLGGLRARGLGAVTLGELLAS